MFFQEFFSYHVQECAPNLWGSYTHENNPFRIKFMGSLQVLYMFNMKWPFLVHAPDQVNIFFNSFLLLSVLDFSIFLIERFQPILRDCNIAKWNAIQFLYLSAFLKTKVVLFYCRVNRLISVHVDLNYKCKRNVSSTCLSFWSY